MSEVSPRITSHLDFQGLGELRGQAQRRESGALRETAQQFEAMFVQQMMKTMRDASFQGGGLIESQAMDTFQSMHDREISLQMARRGSFGLADMLVKAMERQDAVPAADVLATREAQSRADGGMRLQKSGLPLNPDRSAIPLSRPEPSFALPKKPGSFPLKQVFTMPGGSAAPARSAGESR